MDRIDALEERVAHLIRAVEDLSDVAAAQAKALERMERLTRMLAEREGGSEAPAADARPPHW